MKNRAGLSPKIKRKGSSYDDTDLANKILDQLKNNKNNVTAACKYLEISRQTYNNLYKRCEWFREEIDSLSDEMLDYMEGKLFEIVETKGSVPLIMFYLKHKGKSRGYGVDSDESDDTPTQINIKFN